MWHAGRQRPTRSLETVQPVASLTLLRLGAVPGALVSPWKKERLFLRRRLRYSRKRGFSEGSLTAIAEQAGTFAGSLYYHFGSKGELVDAVLEYSVRGIDELIALLESMPKHTSYRDRIQIALEFHLRQALQRDDFILAYWRIIDQIPDDLRAKHLSKPLIYNSIWEDLLQGAIRSGELRQDAHPNVIRMLLLGATVTGIDWYQLGIDWFHLGIDPRENQTCDSAGKLAHVMVSIIFEGVGVE